MRVATMATGGIGGYLAVKLTRAGHEVAAIARGPHLEAIRRDGLRLEGADGVEVAHPWMATDDPAEVGPVDAIVFAVKGDALEAAARACLPMLGPDTVVVPFLNGVEAADRLSRILPPQHVADGVTRVSTTITAPGVLRQTGTFGSFHFGERDNRPSARIDALRQAIAATGAEAPSVDDIAAESWSKFVLFAAMSGVTAAGRCTVGDILAIPELGALFRAAATETEAVARARGVALPPGIVDDVWSFLNSVPPGGRASTAIDIEAGRPIEVEWVSGAAVRLGAEVGVPTPVNAMLYALLLPHRTGH
ncbi:ketopantoate reductase family protein [Jannaschia seohaensis]|uniref:2-dehydropantoate 2-reductase n=1 Tax=Jannaschia seohaensis TaxID=475081 RepID=A0A2Y9A8C3_9RHOB|nr:2-dehydropantoate 2-reductase [Jannaschia seohaensis]PWJ22159.1 2-dehydropantoate 2-reductase [Jannaschia seohaensis]SSA38437.1 2-dehydropantoate 2-reductase [Jannaschia seohaensis]